MVSIFNIVIATCTWHAIWLFVRNVLTDHPRKYAMAIFQLFHTLAFLLKASQIIMFSEYDDKIMYMSMGYFVYDNFGKPFPTVYTLHHVLSLATLILLETPDIRVPFLSGMSCIELSNIPLFWAYALRNASVINKQRIKYWDRITFVCYTFFRLVLFPILALSFPVIYKNSLNTSVALIWIIPGAIWAKKMYKQL